MDKPWLLTSKEIYKTTCDLADESEHPQRWVIVRGPIDICRAQHLKTLEWLMETQVAPVETIRWHNILREARKDVKE